MEDKGYGSRGSQERAETPQKKELHVQVTDLLGMVNNLTKITEDQQAFISDLAQRIEILQSEVGIR